jgi:hypothetical protein
MKNFVIYSGHLENFKTIGYLLWAFDNFTFSPALVYCTKKNLATLTQIFKLFLNIYTFIKCLYIPTYVVHKPFG